MKNFFRFLRLDVLRCTFLVLLSVLVNTEYEYDEVCSWVGGDAGNCVPLKQCRPLLKLLKDRPLLKSHLGILVNLTCEFHLEEPRVCCPAEEALYLDSVEISPMSASPILESEKKHSLVPPPLDHNFSYLSHKNFGKIPSFEKCSFSLSSYLRKAWSRKQTFRGQFPWVALLGYRNSSSGKREFLCGGTVINKKYILTSAQCTNILGYGAPTIVRLAEHDLRNDPDCFNAAELGCSLVQDFSIAKIIVHKNFNFSAARRQSNFENDIAIIGLLTEITFDVYIQPICLPFVKDYSLISFPKRLDSVSLSYSAGWSNPAPKTKSLRLSMMEFRTYSIWPNEECSRRYINQTATTNTQICVGSEIQNWHMTGSALMISHTERSMPKYFQIGIASYIPLPCRKNHNPGIFTLVSSYLQFILDSID